MRRTRVQDTLQGAELSGDHLLVAPLQQVPEDFGRTEQDLAGRIVVVHVETYCLCSSCVEY